MIVVWRRGGQNFSFYRPSTDFVLGVRGGGKSSLLEHQAQNYLKRGQGVLDLYSSRDGENLAWLRSPWANIDDRTPDFEKRILLIHGDNTSVSAPHDTKNISKVNLRDLEEYDLLISSSPLYASPGDEFLQVNKLTDLLYKRLHWKRIVYLIVREASNLYYSRLKINANQTGAKAEMIYLIREARHMGVSMGLDTLKFTSIDLDIRAVIDNLFFKAQGIIGFPRDLNWLCGYFRPSWVRRMKPHQFVVLTRQGSLGVGIFPEVRWHKKEREDILRLVGVEVEHGEEIDYGQPRGSYRTIGDEEHVEIIELYHLGVEGRQLGMGKIADSMKRSPATVRRLIIKHDGAVDRRGYCSICKRAGGKAFKTRVHRTR
jgi:hypothetical protein